MALLYLPTTIVKRETEKAYQLECPMSSYSYARARFWVSKNVATKQQYGQLSYLQLVILPQQTYELTRYFSRREKPEQFQVSGQELLGMFALEHDQMLLKLEYQQRALAADREFEARMQS